MRFELANDRIWGFNYADRTGQNSIDNESFILRLFLKAQNDFAAEKDR